MCKKVVIDVEMCNVRIRCRNYPFRNEIIQIGAVMLDDEYNVVDEFATYVHPEYGKIDSFITGLTGISEQNLRNAPRFSEAIISLNTWAGDGEVEFYAWSDSDYYQVRREVSRKIPDPEPLERMLDKSCWIDYQKVVGNRFESPRQLGLSEALSLAEVDAEGRAHDGLDDARNTAGLIAKLELHPEYVPVTDRLHLVDKLDHTPLSTSLGSLLQGLLVAG